MAFAGILLCTVLGASYFQFPPTLEKARTTCPPGNLRSATAGSSRELV
jgi:hypothetical protein